MAVSCPLFRMNAASISLLSKRHTDIHNMEREIRVGLLQNGRGRLSHGCDMRHGPSQMDANVRPMDTASTIN